MAVRDVICWYWIGVLEVQLITVSSLNDLGLSKPTVSYSYSRYFHSNISTRQILIVIKYQGMPYSDALPN